MLCGLYRHTSCMYCIYRSSSTVPFTTTTKKVVRVVLLRLYNVYSMLYRYHERCFFCTHAGAGYLHAGTEQRTRRHGDPHCTTAKKLLRCLES